MAAAIPVNYRKVEGSDRVWPRNADRLGGADPSELLSVTVRIRRRADAPQLPDLQTFKSNPLGFGRVSRQQFAERYGADPKDLQLVTNFGLEHNLKVSESSIARRTVVFHGTVAQMSRAFAVELIKGELEGKPVRLREGGVYIPAKLIGIVQGVFGLDNRRMARRFGGKTKLSDINPWDVARLYEFPKGAAAQTTIALLEFGGGYNINKQGVATDIQEYFSIAGLSPPRLLPVPLPGATNDPGDCFDSEEVDLDIEVAGSAAPGVNIAVYFAPLGEQGWMDAVTTAVHGGLIPPDWPLPSVISISWGEAELEWTSSAISNLTEAFQEAAVLGVTILAASGDNGSQCYAQDGLAHVNYPASDPWVTGCGGTSIMNIAGDQFDEVTWNDNGVTGGGISDLFPVPPWQNRASIPPSINPGNRIGRGVPDIAGYANGYTIIIDGTTDSGDNSIAEGAAGTSETAPLYAGLVALINSITGFPVGYLNPLLYQYGGTAVFRDVNDGGSNFYPPSPGYFSGPGWDACTGWGSVNGAKLLDAVQTALVASLIVPCI